MSFEQCNLQAHRSTQLVSIMRGPQSYLGALCHLPVCLSTPALPSNASPPPFLHHRLATFALPGPLLRFLSRWNLREVLKGETWLLPGEPRSMIRREKNLHLHKIKTINLFKKKKEGPRKNNRAGLWGSNPACSKARS